MIETVALDSLLEQDSSSQFLNTDRMSSLIAVAMDVSKNAVAEYRRTQTGRTKLIDAFLIYCALTAIVQVFNGIDLALLTIHFFLHQSLYSLYVSNANNC